MAITLDFPSIEPELTPKIMVVGVGGAGGNAIHNMMESRLEGVDFLIANTDAQAIAQSGCGKTIQLGRKITQGLGAGSRPDVGKAAAEETLDEILTHLEGSNMVFITAGMGGGTGTGAAPVIANAAREAGILTVGVVTKPFQFEGVHRMRLADAGIEALSQFVDTLIIIPNQNLFRIANEKTTFADAFKMADDVLRSGVSGVTDLMMMPGLVNLDFADIRSVMTEMGKAMMGTGEASGENRALDAAEAAISNPLLDEVSMKGARGVLINITGGMDLTLFEVDEAANRIRDEVDAEANIIFGSTFDQSMEGAMRVSVVATGIDGEAMHAAAPKASLATTPLSSAQPKAAEQEREIEPATNKAESAEATGQQDDKPRDLKREKETASSLEKGSRLVGMPQTISDVLGDAEPLNKTEKRQEKAETPKAKSEDGSFIPPQPATAPRKVAPPSEPAPMTADPFAESAMKNASRRPEDGRISGLFERLNDVARAFSSSHPTEGEDRKAQIGSNLRKEEPAVKEEKTTAAPKEQSFTAVEKNCLVDTTTEEDMLDIPAFLRRQTN